MMRRVVAGVVLAAIVLAGTTGCGRFDRARDTPPTVAPSTAPAAPAVGDVDAVLESVDRALTEAEAALDAAQEASAQE